MKTPLSQACAERVLSCHAPLARLVAMDSPSRLAVAIEMATSLSETVDPLFRMVGGGTGFGVALMCAFEATRDEPRWDRATGFGAAGGAAIGSMFLLYDIIQSW